MTRCFVAAQFQSVANLTLHFPASLGADQLRICYIGLKGEYTEVRPGSCGSASGRPRHGVPDIAEVRAEHEGRGRECCVRGEAPGEGPQVRGPWP